ncbi:MAG TPA: flagellar biosynthesis anti-sigma factor FlgM [Limnobacter sp.]|uniref:flagellar biosynthesis anti-sigma factor FlgM n=1 Tax=Limnobacter sp. TaxID=2003368 RepID=UPI002ED9FD8C
MSIKINGKFEPGSVDKLTKPQGGSKASKTDSVESSTSESAVTKLSGQFDGIKGAEAPFDAKRVAEIQQAIREGKFEVNAEAVASKVIESARELLGQK